METDRGPMLLGDDAIVERSESPRAGGRASVGSKVGCDLARRAAVVALAPDLPAVEGVHGEHGVVPERARRLVGRVEDLMLRGESIVPGEG